MGAAWNEWDAPQVVRLTTIGFLKDRLIGSRSKADTTTIRTSIEITIDAGWANCCSHLDALTIVVVF